MTVPTLAHHGTLLKSDGNGTFLPSVPTAPSQVQQPAMYGMYAPRYYEAAFKGTTYRQRLGGGNGAVISLRFDDCPSTDYTNVWPLLVARNLPGGFACVSSFLGAGGRITATQMVAMATSGMEILCHTAHHDTNPTLTDAYWSQETDQAMASLRTQAQAVTNPQGYNQDICVENFIQPGTWNTAPADCDNPQTLELPYWLWVQNHFAASEGYILVPCLKRVSTSTVDGIRILPSTYRHGANHDSFCPLAAPTGFASTLAYAKAMVDQCVKYGGLLPMVFHSANLDQAGNLTTADFTSLLDYIQTYRTNDQVDVMTPTAALYCQPADECFNLLADPSFNDSGAGLNYSWGASGSPVVQAGAGYTGGNAIDIDSANSVSQKFQVGQLTEPGCRTLQLTGWYKNASPGSAQVPRFFIKFYDGVTANWVVSDSGSPPVGTTKPVASDTWTRWDQIIRAPRFPAGAGNGPIYVQLQLLGTTSGNKVRFSDLVLKKV